MDALIQVLVESFPPLLYIIVGGCVVYFALRFYIKKMIPVDERTKSADCKAHSAAIEGALKSIEQIQSQSDCKAHSMAIVETKQNLSEIKKSVRAIELALASLNPMAADALSRAHSPRQLTDLGLEVLTYYKADSLLQEHLEYFIDVMNANQYNTALDVEHGAYITLLEQSTEPIFNEVKTMIYNTPQYKDVDMSIATICLAMSFELRNEYLKRHSEIR